MSQSNNNNTTEKEGTANYVELIIYRLPKKNHDAMIQLNNQFIGIFKEHGILQWEVFQLASDQSMEPFTNVSKAISVNQDDEVWLEKLSYRNRDHRTEVMRKIQSDKNCEQGFKQFMSLITPRSSVIHGDFSLLQGQGFVK